MSRPLRGESAHRSATVLWRTRPNRVTCASLGPPRGVRASPRQEALKGRRHRHGSATRVKQPEQCARAGDALSNRRRPRRRSGARRVAAAVVVGRAGAGACRPAAGGGLGDPAVARRHGRAAPSSVADRSPAGYAGSPRGRRIEPSAVTNCAVARRWAQAARRLRQAARRSAGRPVGRVLGQADPSDGVRMSHRRRRGHRALRPARGTRERAGIHGGSSAPISSRVLCIDRAAAPKSTVVAPVSDDVTGPTVEPQGRSLRVTNVCIGTPACSHARRNAAAPTESVA